MVDRFSLKCKILQTEEFGIWPTCTSNNLALILKYHVTGKNEETTKNTGINGVGWREPSWQCVESGKWDRLTTTRKVSFKKRLHVNQCERNRETIKPTQWLSTQIIRGRVLAYKYTAASLRCLVYCTRASLAGEWRVNVDKSRPPDR